MQHKRTGWETQGNMPRLQWGCREGSAMPQWSLREQYQPEDWQSRQPLAWDEEAMEVVLW